METHTMTTGDKGAKQWQLNPTPWKVVNGFVVDANGDDVLWAGHIERAVHAVNCHNVLVEMLTSIYIGKENVSGAEMLALINKAEGR